MIKTWKHKGLKQFYYYGSTAGIQAKHTSSIRLLLFQLANATRPEDMNTPGNDFHSLKGNLKGYFAVTINKNWRLVFQFERNDAMNVNIFDYH